MAGLVATRKDACCGTDNGFSGNKALDVRHRGIEPSHHHAGRCFLLSQSAKSTRDDIADRGECATGDVSASDIKEFGGGASWAQRQSFHPCSLELTPESFCERQDLGLGGGIDRHIGDGLKSRS